MIRNYLFFCLLLAISSRLAAQPGSLDATFGQGGKVTTNVNNGQTFMNSVLIQPDGKIVTVGYTGPQEYQGRFCLIRYNSDGTLDDTFGVDGIVETTLGSDEDLAFSSALQSDGKILAAGYTWNGNDYDFALIRYTAEGLRDLNFGQSGIVTTDFGGGFDLARKVILQPDGKIVLAGGTYKSVNAKAYMAFARYLSNGQLDGSFGQTGKIVADLGEPNLSKAINTMYLQTDGKILAAGWTEIFDNTKQLMNQSFLAIRLNPNGSLDNTFGSGGKILPAIGIEDMATSIQVQSDGKILLFGKSRLTGSGFDDFSLVRYHSNGTLDTDFGNQGVVLTSFDNAHDLGSDMTVQADGKILAFGFANKQNGATADFAMARYQADGSLDIAFGNTGKVTTDFGNGLDWGTALALDSKGQIVAVGRTTSNNHTEAALARYINDVALPVELYTFGARLEETEIQLEWQTSTEANSDHFEVERSLDGKKWMPIGSVGAAINSEKPQSYHFKDSEPWEGENLYRLKMIDLDGTYAYSGIKSVRFNANGPSSASVYPNPVKDKMHLALGKTEVLQRVQLYDLMGVLVFQSEVDTSQIDLPLLKTGPYCLILKFADGSFHSQTILISQ